MSTAMGRHNYGVNKSTILVIKKNKHTIWGNVKASAPASAKLSCGSCHDPFLKRLKRPGAYEWNMKRKNRHLSVVLW